MGVLKEKAKSLHPEKSLSEKDRHLGPGYRVEGTIMAPSASPRNSEFIHPVDEGRKPIIVDVAEVRIERRL